jgi:hypothetical protein
MPNELSFPSPISFCGKTTKDELIIHFHAYKSRKKNPNLRKSTPKSRLEDTTGT